MRTIAFALISKLMILPAVSAPADWQDEKLKSLVRVVGEVCISQCQEGDASSQDRSVGTGFVTTFPNFEGKVIVTALHVVAGRNRLTFKSTNSKIGDQVKKPIETWLIGANQTHDVAVLALPPNFQSEFPALELVAISPVPGEQVITFGYMDGGPQLHSGVGNVSEKAAEFLEDMGLPLNVAKEFRRVKYPSLQARVIGLQSSITHGSSGAPVFRFQDGVVLGMAEGGLPNVDGLKNWAIPVSEVLSATATQLTTFEFSKVNVQHAYSMYNTYVEPLTRTRISTEPGLSILMQWLPQDKTMRRYIGDLRKDSDRSPEWVKRQQGDDFFQFGYSLLPSDEVFLASHRLSDRSDCKDNGEGACEAQLLAEESSLKFLNRLSFEIACFREEKFSQILRGTESDDKIGHDLLLRIGVRDLARRINRDEAFFAFGRYVFDGLLMGSFGSWKARANIDEFDLEADISHVEQLYGGACRARFHSNRQEDQARLRELKNGVRYGGLCITLQLSENALTPLFFNSYLPVENRLDDMDLWGMMALRPLEGTPKDYVCQ